MSKNCCICLTHVDEESASILAMGAYGTPKLLCDECAALVETATRGKDYDEIVSAMEALTAKMSGANIDDRVTVDTMTSLLKDSAKRAQEIKDGTYDFKLDEVTEDEGFDEIPEELQETEEDRLLDKKDEEAAKKFDKVMNFMWIGLGVCIAAFIIYKIIISFI